MLEVLLMDCIGELELAEYFRKVAMAMRTVVSIEAVSRFVRQNIRLGILVRATSAAAAGNASRRRRAGSE